ncbi:Hypothetical protein SMAX5B_014556 [Scophthalmus maximus]|uniref:Uncharacterized protein n=1 Tax=Scophthalmus maximus TaxID=52904 RepID=A0A2U9BZ75_SCOMX|nr:Hypothetical protein SMAX5B_014556 [Scophthalmus maximus]
MAAAAAGDDASPSNRPCLGSLFETSQAREDSPRFKRLLCLPRSDHVTAYEDSPSNLRARGGTYRKYSAQCVEMKKVL